MRDFQIEMPATMGVAGPCDFAHGADGLLHAAGDGDLRHIVGVHCRYTFALTSIPSRVSTRLLLERSPIMRLIGSGTYRTRVGTAMI